MVYCAFEEKTHYSYPSTSHDWSKWQRCSNCTTTVADGWSQKCRHSQPFLRALDHCILMSFARNLVEWNSRATDPHKQPLYHARDAAPDSCDSQFLPNRRSEGQMCLKVTAKWSEFSLRCRHSAESSMRCLTPWTLQDGKTDVGARCRGLPLMRWSMSQRYITFVACSKKCVMRVLQSLWKMQSSEDCSPAFCLKLNIFGMLTINIHIGQSTWSNVWLLCIHGGNPKVTLLKIPSVSPCL